MNYYIYELRKGSFLNKETFRKQKGILKIKKKYDRRAENLNR